MNNKIDKMRFQPNSLSYTTAFLAIGLDAYYLLSVINNTSIAPSNMIAVKILLNILFILVTFLGMIKLKAYEKKWSYVLFGFATITIFRIFYIPVRTFSIETISNLYSIHLIVVLILISALLYISSITAYLKCIALEKHNKEHGLVKEV